MQRVLNQLSILSILLIIISLSLFTTSHTQVLANTQDMEIKLFGCGMITTQPTTAEIFGTIECVDMNQTQADNMLENYITELTNILAEFDTESTNFTCQNIYPLDPACYKSNVYMGYANFQIELHDLSILDEICNKVIQINNVRIDGINYSSTDPQGYLDAIKQAISKANSKVNSLYNAPTQIVEIEELDCYNSHNTYVSFCNIDYNNPPSIEIVAKVAITYSVS